MAKKPRRRRKQQNPVVPIAMGFLFIGIAMVWLALARPGASASAGSPSGSTRVAPLAVNFPAPELALADLEGATRSLADHRASVVLVNNWATWCPPCKAEMPVLQAYFEEHAGEGFMIIGVEAGDSRQTVAQFVQSYGLTFQVWLDPDGAALKAFGNGNLPNSYVIDRRGMVRYAWTGEVDRETLESYVTPLLAE